MIRTNIYNAMGINDIDQYFDAHKNHALVGRVGTVADVSAAIVYLASESYLNGISIAVDGGMNCIGIPGM